MSAWKAKRFWSVAVAQPCEGGFTVRLDAREVKTPARQLLVVPTLQMAQAIALEWDAQQGLVKPDSMPFTRAANSALDKVGPQFGIVATGLAAYGETDLLCYRATGPQALIDRQTVGWNPLLEWAADALNAPLLCVAGVMHIAQPPASLALLSGLVRGFTPFQLAAVHDLVAISGSLVLALAVTRGKLTDDQAWQLSRIDETWQAEQWGIDDDAAVLEAFKKTAFEQAARFYGLCG